MGQSPMDRGHESHHAFEMLSQHFEDLSKSLVTMTFFLNKPTQVEEPYRPAHR